MLDRMTASICLLMVCSAWGMGVGDRRWGKRVSGTALLAAGATRSRQAFASEMEEEAVEEGEELGGRGARRPFGFSRRSLSEVSLKERLGAVPAFYVVNARGSPYLLNRESEGVQECLIFMQPADAEALLSEMVQSSPSYSDARVLCVGMDRAFDLMRKPPVPTGNSNKAGKPLVLRYRLQPSAEAIKASQKRLGPKSAVTKNEMLPCFINSKLTVPRRGTRATPVFLSLDDLEATWRSVAPQKSGKTAPAQYEVHNLLDILIASEQPDAPEVFDKLVFFPQPSAVEYVRSMRRRGNSISRLNARL